MAVLITEECISCDTCAPECPVGAILNDSNDRNPNEGIYYVKPESCVECSGHAEEPRCAAACPTEGAVVWDMPYTVAFNDYYTQGHESGKYQIRLHKKKGLMLPAVKEQKYIEAIDLEAREAHTSVQGSL